MPWGLDASGRHGPGWALEQLTKALNSDHPIIHDDEEWHFGCGWGSFVHCVCECGNAEVLDKYVQKVGTQCLHDLDSRHCRSSDLAFVEKLISHGVRVDNTDFLGRTSLHYAAERGEIDVAACLLAHGADMEAVDLSERTTPMGYAARQGRADMVRYLLDHGASLESPEGREWARPQALAELAGETTIVSMLK